MPAPRLPASRTHALEALSDFVQHAEEYSRKRNYDLPEHPHVSGLSAFIKHRLVLESEVISCVGERHSIEETDKFISEVIWRTYFKGWLENHPTVWTHYRALERGLSDEQLASQFAQACHAETGIACFDHWCQELQTTGYLHNHARMWFASIWIFTLQLPWHLGADFFYRHLLDGDAAANTLSWRWVAGLHTRGKHYLARAENIRTFTNRRFNPLGDLNEQASPIVESFVPQKQLRDYPETNNLQEARAGMLMSGEDTLLESSELSSMRLSSVAGGWPQSIADNYDLSGKVVEFTAQAIGDGLERAAQRWQCQAVTFSAENWLQDLGKWIEADNLEVVVFMEPPVGPWRELFESAVQRYQQVQWCPVVRAWDRKLWPNATAGFFGFKKKSFDSAIELAGG